MKKTLVSTVTALAIMATQVLPMTAISTPDIIADTVITTSAANYAPAKVTGVKASKSYTTVTLSWTKVSKAKGYRVYIYDTATKKYKKITTISKSGTTSYKVTGLTADTTYKFKVRAYRKVSGKTYWGTSSAAVSATTKSYAPVKVTSLTAKATSQTAGTMTWKKIANATGYRVYVYNTATKKYVKVSTITSNKNTYNVTGLKAGTSYKYKVRAYRKVSGKNYWGTSSAAVTLTTNADTSAALDKAYQSLVIGNSTASQRELVRKDLIAYVKKCYPNLTLNENRWNVFLDKNGNKTNLESEADIFDAANARIGTPTEEYSTAYYIGKTKPSSPMANALKGEYGALDVATLAKRLKKDMYKQINDDYDYFVGAINFTDFNIVFYYADLHDEVYYNTGVHVPVYVEQFML